MGMLKRGRRTDQGRVERQIRHAIEHLVPLLRIDGVRIELIGFEAASGRATLRLEGGCDHCDMSAVTLLQGIEANLRLQVPEIREVRAIVNDEPTDA